MPKLVPEPSVHYNPETPLRISIHLPLNGVKSATDSGLSDKNCNRSEDTHFVNENRKTFSTCSPAANSAMPVDLTSRAAVQVPPSSSAMSTADLKHCTCVSRVSSSVSSVGPCYSPISSTSSQSVQDVENDDIINPRQEMLQPSVGMLASFLNQFSGTPADSLQFSPSQSFWTHSFAEQLAAISQNSFATTDNLLAPVLSPVTDLHTPQVNCRRSVNVMLYPASHSSPIPVSNSTLNTSLRRNVESQDCVAVRPTVAAGRVLNVDPTTVCQNNSHKVNVNIPALTNGESQLPIEAVNLSDIVHSDADVLPGMC